MLILTELIQLLIGGTPSTNPTNELMCIPSLDLSTYTWKEKSSFNSLPISVFAHRLCQFNEAIYLIGGILNDEQLSPVGITESISSLYCYQSGIWSKKSPMHTARANFGVAMHQERLYIVGGRTESQLAVVTVTPTVEIYDPSEDKWTKGININEAREGCGLISLAGQLYVIGGYNGNIGLSSVERFDERKQKWIPVSSMQTCRTHGDYIAYNGKIKAFGGG